MLVIRGRQHHGIQAVVGDQLQGIAVASGHAMAIGQHAGMQLAEPPHTGEAEPQEPGRRF